MSEIPEAVDDRLLLTIARQFATAVAPHVEQFAAHGIANEVLAELIQAFETALNERGTRRDEQGQARARIEASLARAFDALATLDVAVPNHLAADLVTLAAWKRDRRVHRPKRSRNDAASAEPEAVPPAAAA